MCTGKLLCELINFNSFEEQEKKDDDENILSLTEFFNLLATGDVVSARWDVFSSTSLVADEVEIDD